MSWEPLQDPNDRIQHLQAEVEQLRQERDEIGMMLCCVNDIEQNPVKELVRGHLQMLAGYHTENAALRQRCEALEALLNTPEIEDFDKAVPLEAAHQIERWTAAHDAGKNVEDWFWLVGYLAGKSLAALKAGNTEKAKHHTISTAAALRNWHAHIRLGSSEMRPGISADKASIGDPPTPADGPHSTPEATEEAHGNGGEAKEPKRQ